MNCEQVREYLFAFLDDELDAALSIEMQRHLDHCPRCAQEAEIERAIRKQLAEIMVTDVDAVLPLEGPFGSVSDTRAQRRGFLRALNPRLRRLLAAMTVAAAVVVLALGVRPRWRRDTPMTEGEAPLSTLLVQDYEHFVSGHMPLQIASAERRVVSQWLTEKTKLPIALPVAENPKRRLVGGRKCVLGGRNAAFTAYDMRGSPAALVVMSDEAGVLGDMREVHRGDRTHWVAQRDGHTVVACRRDRLIYAAVSTLPEEELLTLMDATHEGN